MSKSEVLFDKVYVPVFAAELQKLGVALKGEEQLAETLKIAAMIRMHQAASDQRPTDTDLLKQASANLEAMTFAQQTPVVESAAQAYLKDPEVAAAIKS